MHFKVITSQPDFFPGPLASSLSGKALNNQLWGLEVINIRDFATDKYKSIDDTPYGGGAGMVMKPDILSRAIDHVYQPAENPTIINFSPRGEVLTQPKLHNYLEKKSLILLCNRFEAIDQRVIEEYKVDEISIGDYILSGGELAALIFMDACIRLLPGVIGNQDTLKEESFALNSNYAYLLEYPHYTKPVVWRGKAVPETLLSGNHENINKWRLSQAEEITKAKRKDLWKQYKQNKIG